MKKLKFKESELVTRQDLSNPFHKIPYETRLKEAGIEKQKYEFEDMGNGFHRLVRK